MNKNHHIRPKYFLLAQNAKSEILLGVEGQECCLVKDARDIMLDQNILSNLAPKDAAIIGVIAGMKLGDNEVTLFK